MSRLCVIVLMALSLVTLAACSFNGSEEIDYRNSEITPTLELPPDLIQSKEDKNLILPGSKVGLSSNTGRYVKTGNLNIEPRTLPVIANIKLQGQGDLHWLSVPYEAEKTYPLLREFWLQQGFTLVLDEPIMGMMKTQWMSSKSGSTGFFTRLIEKLKAAESKHQYTTRLHRTADSSVTQVFIAHRQQHLVIRNEDEDISSVSKEGWQFRKADPAFEYEMLSRLMLFLGLTNESAKAELVKIGTFAPRASITQDEEDKAAHITVTDGFMQTRNRLRHQFDRLGIAATESEPDEDELGYIDIDAAALFSGMQQANVSKRKSLRIALEGHGNSDNTRIDVIDDKGSVDRSDEAKQILQSILQLLK